MMTELNGLHKKQKIFFARSEREKEKCGYNVRGWEFEMERIFIHSSFAPCGIFKIKREALPPFEKLFPEHAFINFDPPVW
jgi:hypothetical protein